MTDRADLGGEAPCLANLLGDEAREEWHATEAEAGESTTAATDDIEAEASP